jgi:zinc protease
VHRYYQAPAYTTAAPGEAEALDVLMRIAASGSTSRLYKKLVVESGVASSANGYYSGSGLDSGKIALALVVADGADAAKAEAAMDATLADIVANGVTEAELKRAKNGFIADFVYESDSQSTLARRYGWGLVVGRTLEQIESFPDDIAKVTAEDVQKVAAKYLDPRLSVTGILAPDVKPAVSAEAKPKSRS